MKLDIKNFNLAPEDWKVLAAVEQGTRTHELVPTPLIIKLARLHNGTSGVNKSISTLAKANLIARVQNARYDGYRFTYGGLDYLAMHSHVLSGTIVGMGGQMGMGKESDIYLVMSPTPSANPAVPAQFEQAILKIHRLGRTSFRTLRTNRAYHGSRTSQCSWQHLSQLSAKKEFAAMTALHHAGFPVPRPIAQKKHTVVMSRIPGLPLRQVPKSAFGPKGSKEQEERISKLYCEIMNLALQLAEVGLIHGDFNEFNILIENIPEPPDGDEEDHEADQAPPTSSNSPALKPPMDVSYQDKPMIPHLIDFPQITSLSHPNAAIYFARDIGCIRNFFRKRYHFEAQDADATFADAQARLQRADPTTRPRLDIVIEAAGFNRKGAKEEGARRLEAYYDKSRSDETDGEEEEHADGNSAYGRDAGLSEERGILEEPTASSSVTESSVSFLNNADSLLQQQLSSLVISPTPKLHSTLKAAAGWSI